MKIPINIEEIPAVDLYKVPDNYFERLPHIVQQKCVDKYTQKSFYRNAVFYRVSAVACMLAFVVLTSTYLFDFDNNTTDKQDMANTQVLNEIDEET